MRVSLKKQAFQMASSAAAYPQNPRESPRPLQFHQIPLPRNWTNTHSNWTQLSHQNSSNAVLEEEIQDLTLKLDELQYKLRIKGSTHFHSTNILKQTTLSDSTNHGTREQMLGALQGRGAKDSRASEGGGRAVVPNADNAGASPSEERWKNCRHPVEEWKQKALDYEKEVHELKNKVSMKMEAENNQKRGVPLLSLAKQLAKEKRSFLKEKTSRRYSSIFASSDRREIGNSRQNHRAAFDYHSPERYRIRESFRK
ncbi:hypothetical protein SASPL_106762 [Salvia splendens]|uniref:Uncharacterized protein n=1 Tax=Salvia splendens TaxID=180675 RepID=A0A8X8YMF6_SALSN|nr:hypothetical protein SASPL_106762 [Salvia splendens]